MKQRINVENLRKLCDEQKNRLADWWRPVPGDYFWD